MPDIGGTPCAARAAVHLDGMSDPQSQMYAAMKEAERADQKKRAAGEALRTRQLEYETAKLRGRQQRINRARAALQAAQAAYDLHVISAVRPLYALSAWRVVAIAVLIDTTIRPIVLPRAISGTGPAGGNLRV
jgi:hypothetical protein